MADDGAMTALLALAFTVAAPAVADRPRTFLASVDGIALGAHESVDAFRIETWGVEFKAVCRIPRGWWIEAGSSATPGGSLTGRGSLGTTWLGRAGLRQLRGLVLITLHAPVQREDIRDGSGAAVVPATFKGEASIQGPRPRRIRLTHANVRLVPAARCPG